MIGIIIDENDADSGQPLRQHEFNCVFDFVDPDLSLDYSHLANLLVPQKRRLCQKYFIYNPVRGKCTPTVMVSFIPDISCTLPF